MDLFCESHDLSKLVQEALPRIRVYKFSLN